MIHDLLIVGGGISGLYTGIKWLKDHPDSTCCILERSESVGGRVFTYHHTVPGKGKLHWEAGAGRISTRHKRVLQLIREYGLTFVPIDGSWSFGHPFQSNPFRELSEVYLPPLSSLPLTILGSTTLSQLLPAVYGKSIAHRYMSAFPYYSEFHTLRSDLAIQALQGELRSGEGFGVCAEGLSVLMDHMVADFKKRGGKIYTKTTVKDIQYDTLPLIIESETETETETETEPTHQAHRVVVAIQAPAFSSIPSLAHLPFLKHLKMEPLVRIYAVFPTHIHRSWFSDIPTTVFPNPIRFFIPIRPDKGVAMISYTEGKDAERWTALSPMKQQKEVMKALRAAFPSLIIPDPLYYHTHPWKEGCTYWLPGNYSPVEESKRSIQPYPTYPLYLCNESFAVQQSWMESGLLQADQVLTRMK